MIWDNIEIEKNVSDYAKVAGKYALFFTVNGVKYAFKGLSVSSTWVYGRLTNLANNLDPRSKKSDTDGSEEASVGDEGHQDKSVEEVTQARIKDSPNKPESVRCGGEVSLGDLIQEQIDEVPDEVLNEMAMEAEAIQEEMESRNLTRLKVAK